MQSESDISIAHALAEAARNLAAAGVPDARREASSLLSFVTQRDRANIITHGADLVSSGERAAFEEAAGRRAAGEPLQYITGRQEFFGHEFLVTPDVLIPRPETELLAEAAIELMKGRARPFVCDVGTGSGCIAISLLLADKNAHALALDISLPALEVAGRNASRHCVADRLRLIKSDCFNALNRNEEQFDLVVSNPPYVAAESFSGLQREVKNHEPRIALTAGQDGLDVIRRLLRDAPLFLKSSGYLLFEMGFDQCGLVVKLIDPEVWVLEGIRDDLQGIPRIVILRML